MANRLQRLFQRALGLPPNTASVTSLAGAQFPAGQPFGPSPINPPDISGRVPARVFDFPSMVNIRYRPDAERMNSYAILRWLSDNHLVTRAAINVRKKELVGLDWDITPVEKGQTVNETTLKQIKGFWRRPDGVNPFSQWLNAALEDLFVLDALCIEKRRMRNGDLYGMDVIDGATIHILLDDTGRLPKPPSPAYQQILKGYPRANFTTEELIYDPYNNTSDSPYGMSFLESAQLEINAMLRLMTFTLSYFTEGNTPEGFLDVASELASPQSVAEFQKILDTVLQGNDAERRKVRVIPKGSTYQPVKDVDFSHYVELDKMLTKKVLMAYEVQPHEVGITESVNKSSGQTQESVTFRRAIKPLVIFLEDIFTSVIAEDFGVTDARFTFSGYDTDDEYIQAQTNEILIRSGVRSIDEIRAEKGKPALGIGAFYNGGGQLYFIPDLQRGTAEGTPEPLAQTGGAQLFTFEPEEVEKELGVWERRALKDLERHATGRPFISDVIPSHLTAEIEAALLPCQTAEAVKGVFTDVKKKLLPSVSGKGLWPSSKRTFPRSRVSLKNFTGNGGRASLPQWALRNPY